MKVPLRALSWAIRFFWIIALAFGITCVYSATLIRVNFGEPTLTPTDGIFTVTLPIIFDNNGYYNIADLNITTIMSDNANNEISNSTTYIPQIHAKNNITIYHNVSLNLNEITASAYYLFNDSSFTLFGLVHLNYANIIPFGFKANTTIPWGAPLSNFTAGTPEYSPYNATHLRLSIPIDFENHSPYSNVTGNITAEILNDNHQRLGTGRVLVDVPSNVAYNGRIEILVNSAEMTEKGQIFVYVETEIFNYGPLVINFG